MIGIIFAVMVLSSLAFAIPCGNANALANAVFDGASSAVSLTVTLISVMCLWCGIMNVFEKKGLIKKFSHLISPILRIVFPDAYKKGLCDEISLNISANVLGMGNAATPFGISAMKHLNSLNPTPLRASDDMVMLAERIKARGLSVRETEATVKRILNAKARVVSEPDPQASLYIRDVEDRASTILGRRVKITNTPRKKTVELTFENDDDFSYVLKKLCGDNFFDVD